MTAHSGTYDLADALGRAFALMQERDYVGVVTIIGDAFDRVSIDELREALGHSALDGFGYPVQTWIDVGDSVETADALYELAGAMWLMPHQENDAIELLRQAFSLGLEGEWADTTLVRMLLWCERGDEAGAKLAEMAAAGAEFTAELAGYQGRVNYWHLGITDDNTRDLLRRSLEYNDDWAFSLGCLLLDREEWRDARAVLEIVSDIGGGNPRMILGNLLQDHFDDPAGAEREYRAAMELGDHFSAYNLARMLFDLDDGRDDEAWTLAEYAAARGDTVAQRYLDEDDDRRDGENDGEPGDGDAAPVRET